MASSSSGVNALIVVGIVAALLVVVLSVAACIFLWCWARKKQAEVLETGLLGSPVPPYARAASRRTSSSGSINISLLSETKPAVQTSTRRFSYATLQKATNGFNHQIGEGSFGAVYFGRLSNNQEVAVKVSTDGRDQGEREFVNEVQLLSTVHHKNLVHLVGYCQHENIQILVYEFMAGGDLRSHLYGPEAVRYPLAWKDRLRIASEAAQGVFYLHNSIKPRIIHRDVKSSNILLSRSLEAKVADFGLSKLTPDADCTHVTTTVKGTRGYLDPEYYTTRQLTEYSDVYSFGVLFMELICGRPPIPSSLKQKPLVDWVQTAMQSGTIEAAVDPALQGDYNVESVWKVAELARRCVAMSSVDRPTMAAVLQEVNLAIDIQNGVGSCVPSTPALDYAVSMTDDSTSSSTVPSEVFKEKKELLSPR